MTRPAIARTLAMAFALSGLAPVTAMAAAPTTAQGVAAAVHEYRREHEKQIIGDFIDLWQQIVDLGWPALAIPEAHGGLGLGYLELCVLAEEMGRSLLPAPVTSSVYLATEAIKLAGSDAQKTHWLPRLAQGEAIGTVAVAELGGKGGGGRPDMAQGGGSNPDNAEAAFAAVRKLMEAV